MKNLFRILISSMAILLNCGSLLNAQNIIGNGGFESGMGTWVFSATGGSIATSSIDGTIKYEGNNSLKVDVTQQGSSPEDVQVVYPGFSVTKDLVYVLTFWAYSDSLDIRTTVLFSSTAASNFVHYDSTDLKLSRGWHQYNVIFPSPVTTASDIQFALELGNTLGTVYLDDFILEQKSDSWYNGAALRIEKYREGNFSFKILDKNGNPAADSVKINHKKHEFPWGTAIDLTDKPFGNTYSGAQAVTAPSDSEVYRTERWARYLSYLLPAQTGKHYQITLELSENYWTSANMRLFDVSVDGLQVMSNLDKFAVAGGEFIGFDTTVTALASDTVINLEFLGSIDNAAIMGIVLSDSAGNPLLRLNCGGPAMTTHSGNSYISDYNYVNKNSVNPTTSNDDWLKAVMVKYCNYGVCGNAFKWSGIEATQGQLTYENFDNTLNWFNSVGWKMRAHNLLWGGTSSTDYHELPQWVGQLPPATMYDTCRMRVMRDVTRYKGKVPEYDVLNEPLHATYLQSQVGDSINWNCFKWAHEADSTAKLYINDYNVFEYQNDCNNYTTLISNLLSHGAPISGIGSQCHFGTSIDVPNVKARVDQLAQFGIPIKVTEFDMQATNMTQQGQAVETAKMMRLAFSHPSINGFIFWGLTNPAWVAAISNLINEDKTPRIVADSVYNLIHKVWSTNIDAETDTSGMYAFRGFYGDYSISVKYGNTWKEFKVPYDKSYEDSVFVLRENDGIAEPPVLKKVRLKAPNGVELTFDKPMADPSTEYKNFRVFDTVNNTIASAALKAGDSTTIVLTMINPIMGKRFTPVSYYPGKQMSADGGLLEPFGPVLDETLTPDYLSSGTSKDGKQILMAVRYPLKDASVKTSDFSISVNNIIQIPAGASLSSGKDTLILNLTNQVVSDAAGISLTYTAGSMVTSDSLFVTSFFRKTVNNNVAAPYFVSANTSEDGTSVQIRFSQSMADPSAETGRFSITVNSATATVTKAELLSTDDHWVILTLDSPVLSGDAVKVAYTPGTLTATSGVLANAFTAKTVKNVVSGINDVGETGEISVYPNPMTDHLYISNIAGYESVSVVNIMGQVMIRLGIPAEGQMDINTSTWPKGVYLIMVKDNRLTKAFLIMKH